MTVYSGVPLTVNLGFKSLRPSISSFTLVSFLLIFNCLSTVFHERAEFSLFF
jgi:hypothetical protein